MGIFKRLWAALDERLGLAPLVEFARHKEVPRHRYSWAYYFGGLTLFFLGVQVVTGILLLLYYRPTAEAAFESVQFIVTRVPFGWLVRSIHSWSANLMILSAFAHMFSVYLLGAYAKPRELTWWSGFALLLLAMGFGFSGYLLPWNELSFFATRIGTDIAGKTPLVGGWLLRFLRGGDDVTGATLTRFFGFHVALLPMITSALLALHLLLIQKQGMHVPEKLAPEAKSRPPIPFVPNFALREATVWLGGLALLAVLAAFFPWELGVKADPFAPAPAGIKPEWYFLFMFETLKLLPPHVLGIEGELVGLALFTFGGLVWFLVPLLDRGSERGKRSPLFLLLGWLVLAYLVSFTALSLAGVFQ
ncbi:MAG: cytochrome bc complex cytochrome b subunit [Thermoanaerobaculaceae bacterium]|jgi:cytochrome b6|nr:cytochrome bc complex cytochrome b subunit [Thermoanaerobaculaceae bacterium]